MLTLDATTSLVDYLNSKGIATHRASGNEVTAACWWCNEGRSDKRKLYLNTESWLYDCKVCGETGNRTTLLRHFGDEDRDDLKWAPGTDPALKRKALTEGVAMAENFLYSNPDVLAYLEGRGLSMETIVAARLGYVPSSWSLGQSLLGSNSRADIRNAGWFTAQGQDFFSGHIIIPYFSHGQIVQVRGKEYRPATATKPEHSGKYVSTIEADVRLYGADLLHGAKEALIIEGEFDQMVLRQNLKDSGHSKAEDLAVVGLAGALTLPSNFERLFDACSRVYVGLDPDETGDRATEKITRLLGSKVRPVKLSRDLPKCDWSAYLSPQTVKNPHGGHSWQDVMGLVYEAESEGRILFSVRDARLARAKLEKEHGRGMALGLGDIDTYLKPGLKPGQVMVPLAKTGVGKTAMIATVTHNLLTNEQKPRAGMIATLELTAVEFYDRMRRIALFYDPLITEEGIDELYSQLGIFEGTLGPGGLTRLCEEYVSQFGQDPEFVGVDYLGYAKSRWPGKDSYEKTGNAIMGMKEEAKAGRYGLILPHQVNRRGGEGEPIRIDDARDSGAVEETADILTGWYKPADSGRRTSNPSDGLVTCEILKSRNGRIHVSGHFTFSLASLVLVPRAHPMSVVAQDENRMIITGSEYRDVLQSRRQQALSNGYHQNKLDVPTIHVERQAAWSH